MTTTPDSASVENELDVMAQILDLLHQLDPPEQDRALRWINARIAAEREAAS